MLERSLEDNKVLSLETTFKNYDVEIGWALTTRCNYSCSYCSSYDNSQPTHFRPIEDYENAIYYLKEYLGNKKANIEILGGEPMLYKNWDQVLNLIHNVGNKPKITTNLAINKNTLEKKINTLIPKKVIHVSWHSQFVKTNDMIEKIKLIKESGHLSKISLLGDTRYWNTVVDIYNKLKEQVNIAIVEIHDETSSSQLRSGYIDYTEEQKNFMLSTKHEESEYVTKIVTEKETLEFTTGGEFFKNNLNNFKGMKCEIGRTNFHINPNGDVFPSACFLNYPKARIGNIYKENLKKINKPIICPFNFCGCGPDIRSNKYA